MYSAECIVAAVASANVASLGTKTVVRACKPVRPPSISRDLRPRRPKIASAPVCDPRWPWMDGGGREGADREVRRKLFAKDFCRRGAAQR